MCGHQMESKKTIRLSIMILVLMMGVLAACGHDSANNEAPQYTFGILNTYGGNTNPVMREVKTALTAHGYIEGQNVVYVEPENVENTEASRQAAVEAILAKDVDLILAGSEADAQSIQAVNQDVPIVLMAAVNPIEMGLAESLSSPGSNVTGICFFLHHDLRLQLLSRAIPDLQTVYLPYIADHELDIALVDELNQIAPELGVDLVTYAVEDPADLNEAYESIPATTTAVFLGNDLRVSFFFLARIGDLTARHIAVTVGYGEPYLFPFFLGYGINPSAGADQAARIVDQILDGIKPGDLPIEAVENSLVINLAVADQLGIVVPDEMLSRADTLVRAGEE